MVWLQKPPSKCCNTHFEGLKPWPNMLQSCSNTGNLGLVPGPLDYGARFFIFSYYPHSPTIGNRLKKRICIVNQSHFGPLCSQWMFPQVRNGHWECNGGLDWQGMAIGNTMKKKCSWGIGLDEDLHLPWWDIWLPMWLLISPRPLVGAGSLWPSISGHLIVFFLGRNFTKCRFFQIDEILVFFELPNFPKKP
jgi:hypothetical protein